MMTLDLYGHLSDDRLDEVAAPPARRRSVVLPGSTATQAIKPARDQQREHALPPTS
jgi:hypothetical protein